MDGRGRPTDPFKIERGRAIGPVEFFDDVSGVDFNGHEGHDLQTLDFGKIRARNAREFRQVRNPLLSQRLERTRRLVERLLAMFRPRDLPSRDHHLTLVLSQPLLHFQTYRQTLGDGSRKRDDVLLAVSSARMR